MKFFALISLIGSFLLFFGKPFELKTAAIKPLLPSFIASQKMAFKESFTDARSAHIAWAAMTGDKSGFSTKILKDFKDLELGFFFSPSGIHLTAFFSFIFYLLGKIKSKKISKIIRIVLLCGGLFLPFLALKRIIFLRLFMISQTFSKRKISIEISFLIVFIFSFILGHFSKSPLSYTLSFIYIGTFISLKDRSKIILILGLFSSHLLIAFFSGNDVSLLAIVIGLPLIFCFSFILSALYFYFFTFSFFDFNWIEYGVRFFINIIDFSAKLSYGSFMNSTFLLFLTVWIILLRQKKRYLFLAFFLHATAGYTPTIYHA